MTYTDRVRELVDAELAECADELNRLAGKRPLHLLGVRVWHDKDGWPVSASLDPQLASRPQRVAHARDARHLRAID